MQQIDKGFIRLRLNVKKDDLHSLSFIKTPTLYFLQSSGETIKRLDAVFNIKELKAALLKIKVDKVVDEKVER